MQLLIGGKPGINCTERLPGWKMEARRSVGKGSSQSSPHPHSFSLWRWASKKWTSTVLHSPVVFPLKRGLCVGNCIAGMREKAVGVGGRDCLCHCGEWKVFCSCLDLVSVLIFKTYSRLSSDKVLAQISWCEGGVVKNSLSRAGVEVGDIHLWRFLKKSEGRMRSEREQNACVLFACTVVGWQWSASFPKKRRPGSNLCGRRVISL